MVTPTVSDSEIAALLSTCLHPRLSLEISPGATTLGETSSPASIILDKKVHRSDDEANLRSAIKKIETDICQDSEHCNEPAYLFAPPCPNSIAPCVALGSDKSCQAPPTVEDERLADQGKDAALAAEELLKSELLSAIVASRKCGSDDAEIEVTPPARALGLAVMILIRSGGISQLGEVLFEAFSKAVGTAKQKGVTAGSHHDAAWRLVDHVINASLRKSAESSRATKMDSPGLPAQTPPCTIRVPEKPAGNVYKRSSRRRSEKMTSLPHPTDHPKDFQSHCGEVLCEGGESESQSRSFLIHENLLPTLSTSPTLPPAASLPSTGVLPDSDARQSDCFSYAGSSEAADSDCENGVSPGDASLLACLEHLASSSEEVEATERSSDLSLDPAATAAAASLLLINNDARESAAVALSDLAESLRDEGRYMFDAELRVHIPSSRGSPALRRGIVSSQLGVAGNQRARGTTEYSCSYPGVSWNTRMQSWLVYFEDYKGRKSRTFNPKRLSLSQLELLPLNVRLQYEEKPVEVAMHCACVYAARVRWDSRIRKSLGMQRIKAASNHSDEDLVALRRNAGAHSAHCDGNSVSQRSFGMRDVIEAPARVLPRAAVSPASTPSSSDHCELLLPRGAESSASEAATDTCTPLGAVDSTPSTTAASSSISPLSTSSPLSGIPPKQDRFTDPNPSPSPTRPSSAVGQPVWVPVVGCRPLRQSDFVTATASSAQGPAKPRAAIVMHPAAASEMALRTARGLPLVRDASQASTLCASSVAGTLNHNEVLSQRGNALDSGSTIRHPNRRTRLRGSDDSNEARRPCHFRKSVKMQGVSDDMSSIAGAMTALLTNSGLNSDLAQSNTSIAEAFLRGEPLPSLVAGNRQPLPPTRETAQPGAVGLAVRNLAVRENQPGPGEEEVERRYLVDQIISAGLLQGPLCANPSEQCERTTSNFSPECTSPANLGQAVSLDHNPEVTETVETATDHAQESRRALLTKDSPESASLEEDSELLRSHPRETCEGQSPRGASGKEFAIRRKCCSRFDASQELSPTRPYAKRTRLPSNAMLRQSATRRGSRKVSAAPVEEGPGVKVADDKESGKTDDCKGIPSESIPFNSGRTGLNKKRRLADTPAEGSTPKAPPDLMPASDQASAPCVQGPCFNDVDSRLVAGPTSLPSSHRIPAPGSPSSPHDQL